MFAPIALKLVDLGGGNKSALACSGSADSDGAKQLTNLTNTLFDCEVAVNASCTTDFPMPNMTFVDACANDTSLFVTLATECVTLSKEATASEACACWSAPELAMASEAVKDCKIPLDQARIKANLELFRKHKMAAVSAECKAICHQLQGVTISDDYPSHSGDTTEVDTDPEVETEEEEESE